MQLMDFFGLKIITYLESCENVPETFRELADILRNFRVINAELDSKSGYDPEEIFQIINDTGRMLDDFDYLRNYLFLRTKKYLQNEDVTENEEVAKELDILYDNHWDKFEGEDWNSEKLNLFFRAFLMAKLGPTLFDSEDKDIQPFDCYRKHIKIIEEGQDQKFSPLLQLSCYADFYEKLNNSTTSVEEASDLRKLGNRIRFYDDLKLPPLDWFLLFMNPPKLPDSESCKEDSTELSKKDLNKLCDILESYIIRKWLCDGNYEGSYERIKTFCSEQLNGKTTVTVQKFVEHLSEQWPDPDRVQEVLQERADVVTPDLVLYILYRIEHPNDPVVATQIKKLFSDSNFLHELITCSPSDGWEDLLTETDNIAGRIGNSIGNIESKTTVSVSGWNIEKIHSRIEKLLECFNKIWKPEARDYR